MKIDARNPITKFRLDRITLTNCGIPNEDVNELYRSFFVFSIGFYNMVKSIADKTTSE